MRGFSICQRPLPVVVVNVKDAPAGRTFSLFHELVHILLRTAGVCDFDEEELPPEQRRVEVFCNRVAAAALVPAQSLKLAPVVAHHRPGTDWPDDAIKELARYFSVSREVLVRRLVDTGLATVDFYRAKRQQLLVEYQRREPAEGFAPPHARALAYAGPTFTRVVLGALASGKITSAEVSDYLSLELNHLDKLEAALK